MTEGYKIKIEYDTTLEDQSLEGTLIDTIELNRMGRKGKILTYCMNIMDEHAFVYMWFKDEVNANYFVDLISL